MTFSLTPRQQEIGLRVHSLLRHFKLNGWMVALVDEFQDCPDCPGYCRWAKRFIELNMSALVNADDAQVRNVCFHEVVHALVGEKEAHSKLFRETLTQLERCPDAARAWDTWEPHQQ